MPCLIKALKLLSTRDSKKIIVRSPRAREKLRKGGHRDARILDQTTDSNGL